MQYLQTYPKFTVHKFVMYDAYICDVLAFGWHCVKSAWLGCHACMNMVYVKWLDALRGSSPARCNNDTVIPNNTIKYNTILCNITQYNEIPSITLQYNYNCLTISSMQWNTMKYNQIQYTTMQCNAVQWNTLQYHAIDLITIQYHVTPCNTMKHHPIPCNSI